MDKEIDTNIKVTKNLRKSLNIFKALKGFKSLDEVIDFLFIEFVNKPNEAVYEEIDQNLEQRE